LFWDKEVETISRDELEALQIGRLRWTIKQAMKAPFYRERFKALGLEPEDIHSLEDIRKLPFTVKDDLRQSYPFGMLAVDRDEVIRLHASSGTTGIPTVVFHTRRDIEFWSELVARCMVMTGVHQGDVFQNMMSYGLFTGGLGLHYGAERVGVLVIPAGAGNTRRQIQLMRDFGTTVIHITPSYALYLADVMRGEGVEPSSLNLRIGFFGAEPWSEATREKLEGIFEFSAFNSYGLSEMNGPGVAFECEVKDGMHLWEDAYLLEVVNPETGEVVEDGEVGELVLTTLYREAMPVIRYRTGDLTWIYKDSCPCGRTHRRIGRIIGRTDDMMVIRGVNVFPSQIEQVLMRIPEVGTNYQIVLERQNNLDVMHVRVELKQEAFHGELRELKEIRDRIQKELREEILITPEVELLEPKTLPPTTGKAVRVIDKRQL